MKVRLTHIDGKLPNLALMKIGRWHRERGDEVTFTRDVHRSMFEPQYDIVYGSAIFERSAPLVTQLQDQFLEASVIVGGTGTRSLGTVEQQLGIDPNGPELIDYVDYPEFTASIGFTQRGCRLRCGFCKVPAKEGKNRSANTITDIWRGAPWPRHLHLLDNDFFGQPRDEWQARLREVRAGGFRICFNQGINVRLIDAEVAAELADTWYFDDQFKSRTLYTAWDNLKDERIFTRGVELLSAAGVPPQHLLVYMLVGYDPNETWERIFYRFERMLELGVRPYPMVFDATNVDLKRFQRWVIRRYYKVVPWAEFRTISQSAREKLHREQRDRDLEPSLYGA